MHPTLRARRRALSALAALLVMAATGSASAQQVAQQGARADSARFHLLTLDPGHFHASLVQKFMYPGVDSVVHVYSAGGDDLDQHLARIKSFNTREDQPTHWVEKIHTSPDYLERMIADRAGNVVVIAGNNARKTEYIVRSIDAGLNVLADKPMVRTPADLVKLRQAFKTAAQKHVLLYDIMTERNEVTTALQRALSMQPALFGTLVKGTTENPAITPTSQPMASGPIRSKGAPKRISIDLWLHLSLDALWVLNGVVFIVLLFVTGQWLRIVPTSWDVFPNAVSTAIQYLSLNWPTENGWVSYNALQLLSYFVVVFIAAPLAILTGIRMSPAWSVRWKRASAVYPIELARALHYPTMLFFVLFVIVHVTLVLATGAIRNLNHMYAANDGDSWLGFWFFVGSIVLTAAAWVLARPLFLRPVAGLTGKLSR